MPIERQATGILEDQHSPSTFADELKRPYRPCAVQFVLQSIFMSETIEGGRCRMFHRRQHGQYTGQISIGVTPSSVDDAFAVLPQDLEVAIPICAEKSGGIQL